jgi:hypothetical protein
VGLDRRWRLRDEVDSAESSSSVAGCSGWWRGCSQRSRLDRVERGERERAGDKSTATQRREEESVRRARVQQSGRRKRKKGILKGVAKVTSKLTKKRGKISDVTGITGIY